MKTKYKFIHFVEIDRKPKTQVYACRNNKSDDTIGVVKWYSGWRQYCFMPEAWVDIVLSAGCLDDISEFMKQL